MRPENQPPIWIYLIEVTNLQIRISAEYQCQNNKNLLFIVFTYQHAKSLQKYESDKRSLRNSNIRAHFQSHTSANFWKHPPTFGRRFDQFFQNSQTLPEPRSLCSGRAMCSQQKRKVPVGNASGASLLVRRGSFRCAGILSIRVAHSESVAFLR